MLNQNTHAYI